MFNGNPIFEFISLYRGFGSFFTICILGVFWLFITDASKYGILSRILGSIFRFTGIAPFSSLIYFYLLKLEKVKKLQVKEEQEKIRQETLQKNDG